MWKSPAEAITLPYLTVIRFVEGLALGTRSIQARLFRPLSVRIWYIIPEMSPVGVKLDFEGVNDWWADNLSCKTVPVVNRPYSQGWTPYPWHCCGFLVLKGMTSSGLALQFFNMAYKMAISV